MLEWEIIPQNQTGTLYRCKVPNGWLVKEVHEVYTDLKVEHIGILESNGYTWTSSITFIPDSHHEWDINKEPEVKVNNENLILSLIKIIPNDLLTNYYLETLTNGVHSKKLKAYILEHFNGGEIHLLLKEFKLITLNIHT